VDWNVVYDARGHFEEPHTNRRIGCGTIEVGNYLHALKEPGILPAEFSDAGIDIVGPTGGFSAALFCEKEGFRPLFKAVNLANRYDLMIISTKGVSVTAARQLIDNICGDYDLPLFVLHDFDVAGFLILGTLQRDTRRYQFSSAIEVIDLGLRIDDIAGLEREPAAATRTSPSTLRGQLTENGASDAEINILLNERVELNAMASDALIDMIERKLKAYGLNKVLPDDDLLSEAYQAFHHSQQLRKKFEKIENEFEASEIEIPKNLADRCQAEAHRRQLLQCASRRTAGAPRFLNLNQSRNSSRAVDRADGAAGSWRLAPRQAHCEDRALAGLARQCCLAREGPDLLPVARSGLVSSRFSRSREKARSSSHSTC